jgi:hypothetical protein
MGDEVLIRSSFHAEAIIDTTLKTNKSNCWVRGWNVQARKTWYNTTYQYLDSLTICNPSFLKERNILQQ